jgi:hypothetical protein
MVPGIALAMNSGEGKPIPAMAPPPNSSTATFLFPPFDLSRTF